MIQRLRCRLLVLIAIITLMASAMGQSVSQDAKPKHDGKIDVTFSSTNNETTIRLDEMPVMEGEDEALSMILVGSFSGHSPSDPPSDVLLVLNASSNRRRYQVEPIFVMIADGEVVRTRELKNYGSRKVSDRIVEPLMTIVPYDVLLKMTTSKKISFTINNSDYQLTDNNLEAIRDFATRLVPKKSS